MDKRLLFLLLPLALLAGCGGGTTGSRSLAALINPALGPEYSSWLAGAASRLATPEETSEFLALKDDPQAASFVERFWQRRDPSPDRPGNPVRETFEERAADADRRFSEGGLLGRRTDRGVLFILYGPPQKTDYEVSPVPNGPPVELWVYGTQSPSGLDGKRPSPFYRFIKNGDLTVLYAGRAAVPVTLTPSSEPPL
jgi:GWxTD domain-containing protein